VGGGGAGNCHTTCHPHANLDPSDAGLVLLAAYDVLALAVTAQVVEHHTWVQQISAKQHQMKSMGRGEGLGEALYHVTRRVHAPPTAVLKKK
jgi:hypothetical protein